MYYGSRWLYKLLTREASAIPLPTAGAVTSAPFAFSSSSQSESPMPLQKRSLRSGEVCVSAPGKVLVAGGYVILDPKNEGLTLPVDARTFVSVRTRADAACDVPYPPCGICGSPLMRTALLVVDSPQFQYNVQYRVCLCLNCSSSSSSSPASKDCSSDGVDPVCGLSVSTLGKEHNPFVYHALRVVLSEVVHRLKPTAAGALLDGKVFHVEILQDNDFYAASSLLTPETPFSLSRHPGFSKLVKTGLGSSASLTAALVAGLWQFFVEQVPALAVDSAGAQMSDAAPLDSADLELQHTMAQVAHFCAQGKVGSGFDIATAFCGALIFRTFAAEAQVPLAALHGDYRSHAADGQWSDAPALFRISRHLRACGVPAVKSIHIPPGLEVVLATPGDQCTRSVSLARAVRRWKLSAAVPPEEWTSLVDAVATVVESFRMLALVTRADLDEALAELAEVVLSEEVVTAWGQTELSGRRALMLMHRSLRVLTRAMQSLGHAADVPIVPEVQEAGLSIGTCVPGVLGCVLPGAGGFDALAVLCVRDERVLTATRAKLSDLGYQVLGARLSDGGVRREETVWELPPVEMAADEYAYAAAYPGTGADEAGRITDRT